MSDPATHSLLVVPPQWWACEHPERPHDELACYSHVCDACVVALDALSRRDPTMEMDLWHGEEASLLAIHDATRAAEFARSRRFPV